VFPPPIMQELSGQRLHLSHGPIDVVLKAWGGHDAIAAAYRAVAARFQTILGELVEELAGLRTPMQEAPRISSPVGQRMAAACAPFADVFVTPMAAVAGAVADELIDCMRAAAPLDRAFVNDGGDIAVHTTPGHTLTLGIAGDFSSGEIPALNGSLRISPELGIGGIATSGARGRSFSLGIADSVTVLAANAAAADAAATLIANAVDVTSPAVRRAPARSLDPDSDLRDLPVTVAVGALTDREIATALAQGLARAEDYRRRGLIAGAALMLRGRTVATARHFPGDGRGPRSRAGHP